MRASARYPRAVECQGLSIGPYVSPSEKRTPVERFCPPDEFDALRDGGMRMGFRHVASGPLVRSSYHAEEQHLAASLISA